MIYKMSELKPFLKWAGSKRQLLSILKQYIPEEYCVYYEPFIGAGALFFDLQPDVAIINDYNGELINCYIQIKDTLDTVIFLLDQLEDSEEQYYYIRNFDRLENYHLFNDAFRAGRFIYLNKTGFNGLCRYNLKGQFNVPYGKHTSKFKPDIENLNNISNYLNNNNISILNTDFEQAVKNANTYDFIYFDPPYAPVSETSNFTSYTKDGFTKEDQIRLRDCFKKLTEKGCYCLLSNSYCDLILDLYKDFDIIEVKAKRNINCDRNGRGKISEVLIKNY